MEEKCPRCQQKALVDGTCVACGFFDSKGDYAYTSWTALDVQNLRPDWDDEQCEKFLHSIEGKLVDAMVDAGWHHISESLKEINQYPKYRTICACARVNVSVDTPITKCSYCGAKI